MKKITILFSDIHLSYSPTVIGLYDLLSKSFDVTIVAKDPRLFDGKLITNRQVVYLPNRPSTFRKYINRLRFELLAIFTSKFARLKKKSIHYSFLEEYDFIKSFLTREDPDLVIAVDFKNLLFMQLMGGMCEFLSLEIRNDDKFYESCDFRNVSSVIIQTTERYEHLFDGAQFKTFFIQNAPAYRPPRKETERSGLVYCGTVWDAFGFYHILEFLRLAPEHTLTVKGAILEADRKRIETQYRDLMDAKRLIIESDYLDDADVVEYLRKFQAGFCLYNFDIDWINSFNYLSAPSGKMFKYFAAGVPVIGQDTIGMKPIKDFDCGTLIKDLRPETIGKAVDEVERKFEYYSANCLKAASHYSFDEAAQPFIEYLQTK